MPEAFLRIDKISTDNLINGCNCRNDSIKLLCTIIIKQMIRCRQLKRAGLMIVISLLYSTIYSQVNYIPGYIIKPNYDTITGHIDYRDWDRAPDSISFKPDIAGTTLFIKPNDIIEFGMKEEVYVSGIVKVEITNLTTNKLSYDPQLNIVVDTAFLECLFRGDKELYYYKRSDGRENFYIKQGEEFELLVFKQYLKKQDGRNLIIENNNFLGQLALYLGDCSNINTRLKNTKYRQKSFYSLYRYYEKCSPSSFAYTKQTEKVSAEVGLLLGTSLTTLNFHGTSLSYKYLTEADYDLSVNLTAGIFFDLVIPRNHGKWSINNELLFTSYSIEGKYDDTFNNKLITTTFDYSYLKVNTLVRYKYPVGPVFLFMNGGISNGLAVKEANLKESDFYNANRVEVEEAIQYSKKIVSGIVLGAGTKYKNYSFEVRYEKGNGMSNQLAFSSSTDSYFLLLGYKF